MAANQLAAVNMLLMPSPMDGAMHEGTQGRSDAWM